MQKSIYILVLGMMLFSCEQASYKDRDMADKRVDSLLRLMTLDEKIGQLMQKNSGAFSNEQVKQGALGSVLNEVRVDEINRLQRLAVEGSRLGIPLLFARDVIHGFQTILPIPLGQAASWNTAMVKRGARVAAVESRRSGVRWTFSPMIDVTRDPRWGRVAEGYGEDPYLCAQLGVATVQGYQGTDLGGKNSIVACAKHFAAYGATEAGRDYNTVTLPENELRDVYLPPFKAVAQAGVATFMTAFNELNGIPASGNDFLCRQVLRQEWGYRGMVVSDWFSIDQLITHGYAANHKQAAQQALMAGVDMEMASTCYQNELPALLKAGKITEELIDGAVRNILRLKFKAGLFDDPYTQTNAYPEPLNSQHREVAKQMAKESFVLLKNKGGVLPISPNVAQVAVIGPLANQPHDQLGTWIFDGDKKQSVTPLQALNKLLGNKRVNYAPGMQVSRSTERTGFEAAVKAARASELVLLFLGEESILSGESHCRADIGLPGLQSELLAALAATGKPIVGIVLAGRPLTFEREAEMMDAILYAWHPGTMAGPALTDIVFGFDAPSGKLPITFPRHVGQVPIYYAQKNTGKPATTDTWERMHDIAHEAPQLSVGNTNHYLDYGFEPWFPFGFGLSYTSFEYSNLSTDKANYPLGDSIHFSATLTNTGNYKGAEVAQLYLRDLVGSRTRPVKQLKGFQKHTLKPGESKQLHFALHTNQLGFHNPQMDYVTEPGHFRAWIGGSSKASLLVEFAIE